MDKEKLIELLKDAWNDGMSQYHDCKHHSQYKTDLENWLDANEDEINELCVSEGSSDESAALHLHDVSDMLPENIFYHKENEGTAKTYRDMGTNKWYYESELVDILGIGVVSNIKKGNYR